MPDDFDHLIKTLQHVKALRTLPTLTPPSPRPRRHVRARLLVPLRDRPRARLPSLAHVLERPGHVRWAMVCDQCGILWTGRVHKIVLPSPLQRTLTVLRVPCPVCWALAWAEADQATRAAWTRVPSWLRPTAR